MRFPEPEPEPAEIEDVEAEEVDDDQQPHVIQGDLFADLDSDTSVAPETKTSDTTASETE